VTITVVDSSTYTGPLPASGLVPVPLPGAIDVDDLLVLAMANTAGGTVGTFPGWTQLAGTDRAQIWWRVADGTEVDVPMRWTGAGQAVAVVLTVSGVVPYPVTGSSTSGSGAGFQTPAVTAPEAALDVLVTVFDSADDLTVWAINAPAGYTETVASVEAATSRASRLSVAYQTVAAGSLSAESYVTGDPDPAGVLGWATRQEIAELGTHLATLTFPLTMGRVSAPYPSGFDETIPGNTPPEREDPATPDIDPIEPPLPAWRRRGAGLAYRAGS